MSLFTFINDISGYFEIPTIPPFILTPLNLTKISNSPVYFDRPFIRHLRVTFLLIWALCRHFFESKTILLSFLKREFENGVEKDLCFCHAQLKITVI